MRQNAVVLETDGSIARIRVLRASMCAGCARRGEAESCACGELLGAAREMTALAENGIGADVGDDVEIETATSTVLGSAALVFLLPILAFFVGYALAVRCGATEAWAWAIGGGIFLLSFLPATVADRRRQKRSPQIHIVKILHHTVKESSEDSM